MGFKSFVARIRVTQRAAGAKLSRNVLGRQHQFLDLNVELISALP
jgi:hypothetical protein